ncbi:hypothetical protein ACFRDV_26955 [Streptomyces fagopyri]|uniref:hypothetical protein n=1 Tax=Streptomyces fagopyri TaxID=2662397 RepID=UPI0036ACD259
MIDKTNVMLAISSTGALWLTLIGVVLVALLVAAFVVGSRRAAVRRVSTPTPAGARARKDLANPAQRGAGWSTLDDDPEQGHHRS